MIAYVCANCRLFLAVWFVNEVGSPGRGHTWPRGSRVRIPAHTSLIEGQRPLLPPGASRFLPSPVPADFGGSKWPVIEGQRLTNNKDSKSLCCTVNAKAKRKNILKKICEAVSISYQNIFGKDIAFPFSEEICRVRALRSRVMILHRQLPQETEATRDLLLED